MVCFWEFVIMTRKLLFLATTILLPMAITGTEEEVVLLQLQVCVMLAVICLLLHTSVRPFKRTILNRLERVGLATIAVSFSLLSCAVAIPNGRTVLLALLGVVNIVVILFFMWHILMQLWALVGNRVHPTCQSAMLAVRGWVKGRQPHQQ